MNIIIKYKHQFFLHAVESIEEPTIMNRHTKNITESFFEVTPWTQYRLTSNATAYSMKISSVLGENTLDNTSKQEKNVALALSMAIKIKALIGVPVLG